MQQKSRWLKEVDVLGGFEINQIYQIDCLDGMKRLPTNCVDLIIVSGVVKMR